MRNRYTLLSVACLILPYTISAAEPWGLDRCISYAVQHNLQVKQSELQINLQQLNLEQSKFNYIPSLGASAGYGANFGRSLDPTTYQFIDNKIVNNFNASLQLSTSLFAGMSKYHSLKLSQLNLMASLQGMEKIKNDIMLAVAAAYLQILYNKEQIANSENQVNLLATQIERTAKLVDAGSVAKGALLDLESQKATEEYNLVSYKNQMTINTLTLTQLLELRDAQEFDILTPDVSNIVNHAPSGNVEDIYAKALSLPQIEQARIEAQAAQRSVALARAKLYPTLSASANYGSSFSDARQRPILGPDGQVYYDKYPFINQMQDNANASIGVSLSVPIFYALSAQRGVKIAKVQQQQSKVSLAQNEDKLYKEIGQAWADAIAALDRYRAAQVSVQAAQESFRYAENKFSAGATNAVDYNIAKNALITANSMMTQAKWEYVFKTKILDFYAGTPISL